VPEVVGFVRWVRSLVDARLAAFFAAKRLETERISPRSVELVAALESLTMRGGKRLRPVVAAAAMLAVDPGRDLASVVDLGASLELLQTYLLAHDDFMDGDLERRGGPAVHAIFRAAYADDHLGDSLGVLGGDLASAYSLELFLGAPFAASRLRDGLEALLDLRKEVYFGQHLDIVGDADVARMHDLKTGSYTVRGPARLGGLLGNASEAQLTVLRAWADPLGEAFQLTDDLLGTFGDASATGKPGDDLRHGKRTSLVVRAEAQLPAPELAALQRLLGDPYAPDAVVASVMASLETHGIRAAVEARASECLATSCAALARAGSAEHGLDPTGAARLAAIGTKLVVRDR
jgi:geranylgeranyl diphosphate synthase type I